MSSEWTTEKPKSPGRYWACSSEGARSRVILRNVVLINDKLVVDLGRRYWVTTEQLEEYSHWIGPFDKVPAEPDLPEGGMQTVMSSEWTTEKPKKPGLYWATDLNGRGGVGLVSVDASVGELDLGVGLRVNAGLLRYGMDAFTHWIGPLDQIQARPEPPDA